MSPAPPVKTQSQPSPFDKTSFIKYMKNIGRAYRKQATELVSICRTYVQAQDQAFDPNADQSLRVALQAVDDALKSASEAETKTSEEVDQKIKWATDVLHDHAADWHPKDSSCDKSKFLTVKERMADAKAKDGSTSSILNTLKEKFLNQPTPSGWSKPTTMVEFLVFKSLPDENPTVVKQMLGEGSNLSEVLWNFSRFKDQRRLALKQNPHFYKDLDRRRQYGDDFQSDPIENFLDTPGHKIYVLTDRQGRVYLEQGQVSRAFGNVWCPQRSIIFKDVCGKLEGEGIVGSSIKGKPNLRYCVERLSAPPEANPMDWVQLEDWRDPIRRLLGSPDPDVGNIRIGTASGTEQSGPPRRRRVPPSVNRNPSGPERARSRHPPSSESSQTVPAVAAGIPSNHGIAPPPLPSSIPTQPLPVTARIPLNHGTAHSPPPLLTPTQPRPTVVMGSSNHGTAHSPPPLSTPTQPRLTVTMGSSNHRTAQSSPRSQPSSLRDQATPTLAVPGPLTKLTPPNQHHATPTNTTPERQSQVTKETINISLSVAVTAPPGVTSSHKSHTGSSRNVPSHADPLDFKLPGPPSKAPKSDAAPPAPQTPPQKPAQRPVWQVWVQKVWKGGK